MATQRIMTTKGFKEFERAIKRNPQVVASSGKDLITDALAKANKLLFRSPWKVGDRTGVGKGVPVAMIRGGKLRDTHQRRVLGLKGMLYPTAPYSKYVHGGKFNEINRRTGVNSRPWLDRVGKDIQPDLKILEKDFLKKLTKDLAR